MSTCIVCGTELSGKQQKYCSDKCRNIYNQNYKNQQSRGLSRKLELIRLKGSKCSICGYNKNIAVLSFHHQDPSTKELQLTFREISNNNFDKIKEEVEKCVLLCMNCHTELHYPHYNDIL